MDTQNRKKIMKYLVGYALSIVCTLATYGLVVNRLASTDTLVAAIVGLALLQCLVQLVFFLHIGEEHGPRANLMVLVSTVGVVGIVVGGALWIMHHLNYNMTPSEVEKHQLEDEGIDPSPHHAD